MGIRGLFQIIKNGSVFDVEDLVAVAKEKNGIEILVDFHALIRYFTEIILKKLATDYHYAYLECPIGVYDVYAEAIIDLHNGFREAGIALVWVVDGPKGVDALASDQKSETWSRRDRDDIAMMNDLLTACGKKGAAYEKKGAASEKKGAACQKEDPLPSLRNFSPIVSFELALWLLKIADAEVINLLQGMSDDFIAYEFRRRNAYAILTNDTDFIIFPDCVVIFEQLLSHKYEADDLKIPFVHKGLSRVFQKPSSLLCPVVKQERMLKSLKFTSQPQLIALSILTGNDNTKKFADKLAFHLKTIEGLNKTPKVNDVVKYIIKRSITSDNLEELPHMEKFMADFPDLKEAIQFCRNFYSLKRIEENMERSIVLYDPSTIDDPLTGFLAQKLSKGEISKKSYSMHLGILYDAVFPERPSEDCPPILTILVELRQRVYPFILSEKLHEVVEQRSRGEQQVVKVPVEHADVKTHMIKGKAEEDSDASEIVGIDLFEEVICHMEIDGPLNLSVRYGVAKAFVCHILRYMFLLTKEKNLRLSKEEFRSLFLTVFFQYSRSTNVTVGRNIRRDFFLQMNIRPTARCLIIGTWFMNIYHTAKYYCGAAFNLTEDFPEASLIMSGPVFYGFYEHIITSDSNGRTAHLEKDVSDSIEALDQDVMAAYSEEYAIIIE